MPAMWKIAVLAFASFAAAMPSSPDAEPRALFAIEKRCTREIYQSCKLDSDCCGNMMRCNGMILCGDSRCVSYDPNLPYEPYCRN